MMGRTGVSPFGPGADVHSPEGAHHLGRERSDRPRKCSGLHLRISGNDGGSVAWGAKQGPTLPTGPRHYQLFVLEQRQER